MHKTAVEQATDSKEAKKGKNLASLTLLRCYQMQQTRN